ncbi:unnamed protein product [Cunninghamella blakesleeana]
MLIRISQRDWPDGLCMIQVAQIDKLSARVVGTRNWKVWKLLPPKHSNLDIYLDKSIIKNRLQTHLSDFFKGHVYCFEHEATKTIWYRIQLFLHSYQLSIPRTTITIVHFPKTEYLIFPKPAKLYCQSISHCLLKAFNASSIKQQSLTTSSLTKLIEITEKSNTLGVFTQFSALQSDPNQNPLLLSRTTNEMIKSQLAESPSPSDHQQNILTYTSTPEQNRRIIPINQLQLTSRYNHIEDVFGKYPLTGSISLSIKFDTPITHLLYKYGITESKVEEDLSDGKYDSDMDTDNKNNDDDDLDGINATEMEVDNHEKMPHIFSDDVQNDFDNDIDRIFDSDDDNDDENKRHHGNREAIVKEKGKQSKYNITMNVTFTGNNIAEGLRQMAIQGYCDPPFPVWVAETINSGSTHLYVSKDKIILDYGDKYL